MAVFRCNFKSNVQQASAAFNVILPEQCISDVPVVYLLHGLGGDQENWLRFTSIERYAIERSLAVVMPGVGGNFYSDTKYSGRDYTYVSQELIDYSRRIFPLSHKREKTFVAGLSMGGYGALKFALGQSEKFAACASLSGPLDICRRFSDADRREMGRHIWGVGHEQALPGSEHDLFALVKGLEENGKPRPWILQACGTEDALYSDNVRFRDFMEGRGFTYSYHEGPGGHTWDVWDHWIVHALDFFRKYMEENHVEEQVDREYRQAVVVRV